MQKIKSPEQARRDEKRLKFIVGGVLILLLVFSTAGFALYGSGDSNQESGGSSGEEYFYNGQYFVYDLGGQQYYFNNIRENVNDVGLSFQKILADYSGNVLFIDSEDIRATSQIALNLGRFSSRVQEACYGECEEDFPEKSCQDNLIIYRTSEKNRVYQEDNCIFIDGDLKTVDAFLYKLLGFDFQN